MIKSWRIFQVLLLTDSVCLFNESAQLLIQILSLFESEMMDTIVPRNRVDAVEARSLVPVRQDQVADDPGCILFREWPERSSLRIWFLAEEAFRIGRNRHQRFPL